jgi:hypothetical protein
MELTLKDRAFWLAGAVVMGLLSQWCMVFGPCGAPV